MAAKRTTTITLAMLGLFLVAGCFVAGFLLIRGNAAPTLPPEPVATAVPENEDAGQIRVVRLVIKKAVYGDLPNGPSTDVTEKVAGMASKSALSVDAENDNFGDPAPTIEKKLRVDYTLDGVARSKTVTEHQNLKIIARTGPDKLVIKKAVYGDLPEGSSTDVTQKVASIVEGDLSIPATNDNFGDPAPTIPKKLRVDYTFGGKDISKTVTEGETLTISATGE